MRACSITPRRRTSPAGFGEVRPGLTIPGKIDKMGYKGVDTTSGCSTASRHRPTTSWAG
jgi:hypothetical protein